VTRIASVKPHPISVPLNDPVWTAHEELKSSSVIVVEVRTDDGLTGYGQIHGSPMKAICAWVERFGEIVRGMDALAHVAVSQSAMSMPPMAAMICGRSPRGRGGGRPSAPAMPPGARARQGEEPVPHAKGTLLRRHGTPDEVVACILFLASDDASYVTGTLLFVDGGYTAM
jgi:Enoyl-(Acyl carrier protein) reductase